MSRKQLRFIFIVPVTLPENLPDLRIRVDEDCSDELAELNALWKKMRDAIKPHVPAEIFNDYFLTATVGGTFPSVLELELVSSAAAEYFLTNYETTFRPALTELNVLTEITLTTEEKTTRHGWTIFTYHYYGKAN